MVEARVASYERGESHQILALHSISFISATDTALGAARERSSMGLVNGTVILKNPRLPEVDPVEVEALSDSGTLHLCIPEHVKIQLRLEAIDCKEVTLVDGSRKVVQYVGPIRASLQEPSRVCGSLGHG